MSKQITVKKLIEKLQKIKNQDLPVVIGGTDPTDYQYYNDIESIQQQEVYLSEDDDEETTVLVIDGGCF